MENDNNVSYQGSQNFTQADPNKSVMTMGEWVVTLIITMIPCVDIIMLLIWAFGNGNENRKNFSRAFLIVKAVAVVLFVILYLTIYASLIAATGSYC